MTGEMIWHPLDRFDQNQASNSIENKTLNIKTSIWNIQ